MNLRKLLFLIHKYIYDNYDKLDDYTIFLQGNPFDHSPNLITNLVKYLNNKSLDIDFEYIRERIITCILTGDELHPEIPLIAVYEKVFGEKTLKERKFDQDIDHPRDRRSNGSYIKEN